MFSGFCVDGFYGREWCGLGCLFHFAKGIFDVDVLYPVSEGLILVFGRMVRLLISYSLSFVRMFIFTGRSAVPTSILLKEYLALMFFILSSNRFFYWARGANARGEPKEDRGKVRKAHIPPIPFRFSPRAPLS